MKKLEQAVRIGMALPQEIKEELLEFLREYKEVFSWKVGDIQGID